MKVRQLDFVNPNLGGLFSSSFWGEGSNENISFTDYASGIRLPDCSKLAKYWKNNNDIKIYRHDVISKTFWIVLFSLSSLVTGPSFMSISLLVLELWQFFFIRDWPEIQKLEILPSEFCPLSRDWVKLEIPDLPWMSLMKFYWMLQNVRVTASTVSELLTLRAGTLFQNFWKNAANFGVLVCCGAAN